MAAGWPSLEDTVTVRELIEKLQDLDPDLPVAVRSGGSHDWTLLETVRVIYADRPDEFVGLEDD